jgi:ubiquitin
MFLSDELNKQLQYASPELKNAISIAKVRQTEKLSKVLASSNDVENKVSQLKRILNEEVSVTYQEKIENYRTEWVSAKEDGYEYESKPKYILIGTTEKSSDWKGQLLDWKDLLTLILQEKNSLNLNKRELYQCIRHFVGEKILSSPTLPDGQVNSKDFLAILKRSIAFAIEAKDFAFVKRLLSHPTIKSLPLLSAIELNGKNDNLLHYYFEQKSRADIFLQHAYYEPIQKEAYFPQELISLAHSFIGKDVLDCEALLLSKYIQKNLEQVKAELDKRNLGKDVLEEVKSHFSQAMKAFCKWRQLINKSDLADNVIANGMDKKIKEILKLCFLSYKKNIQVFEEYVTKDLQYEISNFCEGQHMANVEGDVNNLLMGELTNYLKAQEQKKKLHDNNMFLFCKETEKFLQGFCDMINDGITQKGGKQLKNGEKPLKGIKKAHLKDNTGTKIEDGYHLSRYIRGIYENKDKNLPDKLKAITDLLLKAYNAVGMRRRHRWLGAPSNTLCKLGDLIENLSKKLNDIICKFDKGALYSFDQIRLISDSGDVPQRSLQNLSHICDAARDYLKFLPSEQEQEQEQDEDWVIISTSLKS